jgi:fimbrial chaperone protein
MNKSFCTQWLAALLLLTGLACRAAYAGSWGVAPLSIDLDSKTRSAVFNIWNSGDEDVLLHVRPRRWEQDAEGKDIYTDTRELIVFPLQLKLAAKEQRIVRVGYRNPALGRELAYRVMFEESAAAPASAEGGQSVGVAVGVAFALPVYLRPGKPEQSESLEDLALVNGKAGVRVRNTGNVRFRINKIRFTALAEDGTQTLEKIVDGWYLLPAAARIYRSELPRAECERSRTLIVEMQTEHSQRSARIPVEPRMCL